MDVLIAAYFLVACKSFQQLNVVNYKYLWVFPTSYVFAAGEIFIVLKIVFGGWDVWFWMGTGAGLGAITAMYFHKKMLKRWKSKHTGEAHG